MLKFSADPPPPHTHTYKTIHIYQCISIQSRHLLLLFFVTLGYICYYYFCTETRATAPQEGAANADDAGRTCRRRLHDVHGRNHVPPSPGGLLAEHRQKVESIDVTKTANRHERSRPSEGLPNRQQAKSMQRFIPLYSTAARIGGFNWWHFFLRGSKRASRAIL